MSENFPPGNANLAAPYTIPKPPAIVVPTKLVNFNVSLNAFSVTVCCCAYISSGLDPLKTYGYLLSVLIELNGILSILLSAFCANASEKISSTLFLSTPPSIPDKFGRGVLNTGNCGLTPPKLVTPISSP